MALKPGSAVEAIDRAEQFIDANIDEIPKHVLVSCYATLAVAHATAAKTSAAKPAAPKKP